MQGSSALGDWTMMNPWKEELDERSAGKYRRDRDDAASRLATTSLLLTFATMYLQIFDTLGTVPTRLR